MTEGKAGVMKKRIVRQTGIWLAAAVLVSYIGDSVPMMAAQAESSGVTVQTEQEFMQALAQKQSPITVDGILTIGGEADTDGRMKPVMIPEDTVITGTEGSSVNSRSPIQLAGDHVTIQDVEWTFSSSDALGSVPHREIFLAGHRSTVISIASIIVMLLGLPAYMIIKKRL